MATSSVLFPIAGDSLPRQGVDVNALYSCLIRFLADLPLLVHCSVDEREGREIGLFVGHGVLGVWFVVVTFPAKARW